MFYNCCVYFFIENVEVFFKSMGSRHGSESQEIDQPDYDSVASDEDTDTDLRIGKADRAKVNYPF